MLTDDEIMAALPGGVLDCLADPWDEGVGDGDTDRSIKTDVLRVARAIEAATLATVTPLLRDLLEIEDARIATGAFRPNPEALRRIEAARAFLSGATKESTDHG